MYKLFIKRPILSGVISVIFICLGALAINSLPITQFPDIVPPSVTVTARYTGASADVMSKTVATPLERAINGVPGDQWCAGYDLYDHCLYERRYVVDDNLL